MNSAERERRRLVRAVEQAEWRRHMLRAGGIDPDGFSEQGRRILAWLTEWDQPTVNGVIELLGAAQVPVSLRPPDRRCRRPGMVVTGTGTWTRPRLARVRATVPVSGRPPPSPNRRPEIAVTATKTSTRSRAASRLSSGGGPRARGWACDRADRTAARAAVDVGGRAPGLGPGRLRARRYQGVPLTPAALAASHSRSVRWAQERIAEVRDQRSARSDGRSGNAGNRSGNVAPVSGTQRESRSGQRVDAFIVAVVALVAAAASYEHQRSLAVLAGEGGLAWVLPISVDGMMLATSRSILRRRRSGIPVAFLSWFGFALGFIASVAANVAAAEPTMVGRLLAAWPPVALFIAYETLAADHGEFR